ncbi:hypothetical protein, partial [Mucilaginibacter sp. 5C4]|uniref:hypothetical protein n=1 Tax=Mucilaginibacter sp. 5C4 TaxID=3048589 RepID=UPI002B23C0BF
LDPGRRVRRNGGDGRQPESLIMPGTGPTVLLVGTDAGHRAQLAGLLAQHGYTLLVAGNHGDALAVMVRQVPGLLIIDLAGASQDGLALLS